MPALSKSQQRLFGWVHAVQKGEAKGKIPPKIRQMAERVDPQDARDFAATGHKGLPGKKKATEKAASYGIRLRALSELAGLPSAPFSFSGR